MDAARFNILWYLSLLAPALIMITAFASRKLWVRWAAAFFSVACTYWLSTMAVARKWSIRADLAVTDVQRQWVYDHDGGDQAFAAVIFGPIEAVLATLLWAGIAWAIFSMLRRRSPNKSLERTRER